MAVKNTILRKKINDVLTDLMVKTTAAMVYVDDSTTLVTKLGQLSTQVEESKNQLAELLGEDPAKSITGKISTAINEAITALQNEDTPGSIGARIKALETLTSEITNESTGILATAKAYTDQKLGLDGTGFDTVKAYVDNIKETLGASIAGAFHYKGTLDYVDLLPAEGMGNGDVWQIKYAGQSAESGTTPLNAEYVWNGTEWEELGSVIDLSAYSTTEQVTAAINQAKTDAAADAQTKANAAQSAAEATAASALNTYKEEVTTALATKGRVIASESEPQDMTENDLWFQIIEDAT